VIMPRLDIVGIEMIFLVRCEIFGGKLHALAIKELECGRFVFVILGFAQNK
jgi:hypothetical protein